jgi:hypothetical protein
MREAWTPVAYMAGVGAAGYAAAAGLPGDTAHAEVAAGLAGPLASTVISWLLMVRAATEGQARLMGLMVKAMAAKMLLFGAYVTVAVLVFGLRPVPFVVSFTGFFIALYVVEALYLKRLVATGTGAVPGVRGREA